MVLVIAFLTVSNIALGYGLAVYMDRHFGTLLFVRRAKSQKPARAAEAAPKVTSAVEPPIPPTAAPKTIVKEEVAASTTVGEKTDSATTDSETTVSETTDNQTTESETADTVTAALKSREDLEAGPTAGAVKEPVDEENVLAGIEQFRSQLAKMSGSGNTTVTGSSVDEQELVGAAN
jgi:hypothetical protein